MKLLLTHFFEDPSLNLTLELFLREVAGYLGRRLLSVTLYGSVVFADLAPGYGDLDFLVVVKGDLTADDCHALAELRKPFRRGGLGILAHMLEGAFLPASMLDPAVAGRAYWWGTSREREWDRNELGWLVLKVIRERGWVIFGDDIAAKIPEPAVKDLLEDALRFCASARKFGRGGELHSVDWLLAAARLLLWAEEDRLSSKTEAAAWGKHHAQGKWRELLPEASRLRLNPSQATMPEARRWLAQLDEPIQEACSELEAVLLAKRH